MRLFVNADPTFWFGAVLFKAKSYGAVRLGKPALNYTPPQAKPQREKP